MNSICIKSDFTDYYDILQDKNSILTYNRNLSECKQRGTALKYVRSLGLKTIEVKPVNQYISLDGSILVYTNPKLHNGEGKKIMTVDEAMQSYSNCIASKFYDNVSNVVKFLQIGKRRFTLYFKKDSPYDLSHGKLVDIRESLSEYNRLIGLPILSIDYIEINGEMVATDFNEVENLKNLGIDEFIRPEDIIKEIKDSLIVYNKV